ncbi:MAG: hypothetical protein Q9217_006288 [Psora testacea]
MAPPSIPNLNTLRGGRGRGRGRGLGSLGGPSARNAEGEKVKNDRIIQQTDQDASLSRMSAVEAGYLDDPFAKLFVTSDAQRRFPIINRGIKALNFWYTEMLTMFLGTYVRTKAIDKLVDEFLKSNGHQKKQIISLGAGSDTRFFRIMTRYPNCQRPDLIYHEMDFSENTVQKLAVAQKSPELLGCIRPERYCYANSGSLDDPLDTLRSPTYHLHPIDLRTLDHSKELPPSFQEIDRTLPTLIISECCLVYLAPAAADTVALYFTKHLFPSTTPLGMILYEPVNPHDAFGKVMVSNLAARGIVLQTMRKYGSFEAQAIRMKAYGFDMNNAADVNELWKKGVDPKEKERVAGLEMVDEVEEWELLAAHYCVVWGWRSGEAENGKAIWKRWEDPFG